MSKIVFVTGGARSGKSRFAEELCRIQNNSTAYIATSIPFDEDMKDRVKKHRANRPSHWTTYEVYEDIYKKIPEIAQTNSTVILDCVTLLVNNIMFKEDLDFETCDYAAIDGVEAHIKEQVSLLIKAIKKTDLYFVIVTNEIGMSVIGATRLTRVYTDIIGRVNQQIAADSDEVYLVVCGIPVKIRG
ncbi:bifunctional adenosylcobinamide kinase/adenosylcobinamide-phosphate guanylyltransferase [Cellulosilyticum sp. I15G10I2]|uniref:bifunctional adenosylcobinamide kinase/adenosylcobinamide-phosphate guanylyltransferase n=1 Tax=Cellulosilyticum sp. I15G10I2 TaxID=1892843 RepID=UPI00085CD25C|nr:bifunctional adenosylcobinamide kinase/adenosylcobinamide-phosphate guanylyltransferase [Cellulosilyticum sp. I15G10I2]